VRGRLGLVWLRPCRHVSGFGSSCPGGLPASVQSTAGAEMSLHLYPPMTLCVGDLSSCLCSKPYSYGTPEWLMCLGAVLPRPEAERGSK
jgi:hypothetical protein